LNRKSCNHSFDCCFLLVGSRFGAGVGGLDGFGCVVVGLHRLRLGGFEVDVVIGDVVVVVAAVAAAPGVAAEPIAAAIGFVRGAGFVEFDSVADVAAVVEAAAGFEFVDSVAPVIVVLHLKLAVRLAA
jgi:hypothetical protein